MAEAITMRMMVNLDEAIVGKKSKLSQGLVINVTSMKLTLLNKTMCGAHTVTYYS